MKQEAVHDKKTLSLAEQKELLRQKKEALLKKKAAGTGTEVKQEPKTEALLPSLQGKAGAGDGPIPLILDEQGRQVGLNGKLVSAAASKATANKSLLINKRVEREKVFGGAAAALAERESAAPRAAFDPRISAGPAAKREKKSFRFVEPGTFVRREDRAAAEQKLEVLNRQMARAGEEMTPELALEMKLGLDAAAVDREPIPEYEWWDVALAGEEGYVPASYDELEAKALARVNNLLEHPKDVIGLKPEPKEVSIPLMLTDKERKRMRREERVAKQETMRAQITLGIIPPPPPKVKLSNMERVFGAKMVENPTAVEAEVRRAMQERLLKHLVDNEARKLTPTERREKKLKVVIKDRKEELRAAVFRIDSLANPKHVWKVATNAKQMHCTGVVVVFASVNVVVVEGGPKAVKFMKKLLLRRMDWNDASEAEAEGAPRAAGSNKCAMVWEGALARPSFQHFSVHRTEGDALQARQVFEDAKCPQYWDLARSAVVDDALPLQQKLQL